MKTLLFLLISFASFGQVVRPPRIIVPFTDSVVHIPYAGMYIILNKDQPFPKCADFDKINWESIKKRHKELSPKAKDAHEVTLIYPGNIKAYLTFDQLKEIACK